MTRETVGDWEAPRCDKCGLEITTGLMAVLCPLDKDCALRPDDAAGGAAVDKFREMFGMNTATRAQGGSE